LKFSKTIIQKLLGQNQIKMNIGKGKTVIGGYILGQAEITVINASQLEISYRFTDHYGADTDDQVRWIPGLPSMYYLQHYMNHNKTRINILQKR
jgi:hypothetical protein